MVILNVCMFYISYLAKHMDIYELCEPSMRLRTETGEHVNMHSDNLSIKAGL